MACEVRKSDFVVMVCEVRKYDLCWSVGTVSEDHLAFTVQYCIAIFAEVTVQS